MFRRSLGLKIIALVIAAFAIFAYVSLKTEERQIQVRAEQMVKLLANTIYSGLSQVMLEGGPDKAQRVQQEIENYGLVEEIDRIRIFDPEDRSIWVTTEKANSNNVVDQQDMSLLADGSKNSELFSKNGERFLTVITPILNEKICERCHEPQKQVLGVLDIDVSVADMFRDVARNRLQTILFSLLAVVGVSLAIMLFVVRYRNLEGKIEVANEELGQKITALTEIKNFNDSILQNMSNGLITVDIEGKIAYFNAAAEAILGYDSRTIQGKPIEDVFDDLGFLVLETLQKNNGIAFHEAEVSKKTGEKIHIAASTSLLKDDPGRTTGVVMLFTDLTERREMEQQIRRADKLATLGQLAAGIAHEIRNPLAGISGAVQILREDAEGESRREIFGEIVERINRLDAAIGNFLRFARPAPLQFSPTDMNAIVQSVLFLVSKQAESQGVSIVEEYDDSLPIIMADSEQMQQVILNIALNSLQAIRDGGGRIRFRTFQGGKPAQIVVEISDTGIGIPDDKLEQIFAPYFTTKSEGTGLGLSIAQRIVEEHGGNISVESEVGKGTVFRVELKHG